MGTTQITQQTLTPQNAFPLVGSLEDADAIAQIGKLLLGEQCGLMDASVNKEEKWLCKHYRQRLDSYPDVDREQWGRLKELCLLVHSSPVSNAIDYLASAHRTPAIAESAIRSAGTAMYAASERMGRKEETIELFRRVMAGVIKPASEEELNI